MALNADQVTGTGNKDAPNEKGLEWRLEVFVKEESWWEL